MIDTRSPQEWRQLAEDHGYPVLDQDTDEPWWMWVRESPRVQLRLDARRLLDRTTKHGKAPAVIFENHFTNADGCKSGFKYLTHGLPDHRDVACIEDYADKAGAQYWKDYVRYRDPETGRMVEGPKPFRSKAERREYEMLTGQRRRGDRREARPASWDAAGDNLQAKARQFFLEKLRE